MASYKVFREPSLITDPLDFDSDFSKVESRRLRYAIYWSFYENDAYRDIHNWTRRYRVDYGLYKYIRNIYNPTYRLGEFWKSHLWGGQLDPLAGDGEMRSSALPIAAENERLRPALSQLWQWSNWQINKDIASLYGTIFGDVAISVVDDIEREKVYLQIIHPGAIQDIELDPFGNIKSYVLEEEREDPRGGTKAVIYGEAASRDGDSIIYQTFLNGAPFAWSEIGAEWTVPYGFIPMVIIQHNNVGLDWGWSEIHALRSRIHEVDDLASKLHDQIRKMVDAPWLFAGVDAPRTTPTTTHTALTGTAAVNRPMPDREEIPSLYGPQGANAIPLIAPLDIAATSSHIKELLGDIEREHPELQMDIWTASGDASGRALRVARQRVETKVLQRRAGYDDALVRAQQMAVAIGGWRGYDDFSSFGLDSFGRGDLDHSIGSRPVFAQDPLDALELKEIKFKIGDLPVISRWRLLNFTDEEIAQMLADKQREDELGLVDLVTGIRQ